MSETKNTRAWSKPKLIVIARNRSEERVLNTCKQNGGGVDNWDALCKLGAPGTGFCDVIKPS